MPDHNPSFGDGAASIGHGILIIAVVLFVIAGAVKLVTLGPLGWLGLALLVVFFRARA
jgi:hypothetical protein